MINKKNEKVISLGYTIGRFNPLHLGHTLMIDDMKYKNDYILILIGSANISRTNKNPLTYQERSRLLANLYPNAIILPLNDYNEEDLWIENVDRKVLEAIEILNLDKNNVKINLHTGGTGKGNDAELRNTWCKPLGHNVVPINLTNEICEGLSATKIRSHFYREEMSDIVNLIPQDVYTFLDGFRTNIEFKKCISNV